jgi:hypothetical protein
MAAQLLRDRGGPQSLPPAQNHPGPPNPIAGCVATLGEPLNLALLRVIAGIPGVQEFRQRRLSIILDDASILHLY